MEAKRHEAVRQGESFGFLCVLDFLCDLCVEDFGVVVEWIAGFDTSC